MSLQTAPKKKKKVSFMMDATGFNFTPSKEKSALDKDNNHWNSFGSLSKSEFSFMSDRSSFAASLNTISDSNLWIVDPEQENEHKLDLTNNNNDKTKHPAFTFGHSNTKNKNHIQDKNIRKISVTSPSMSQRHSKSAHSITFSSTVSLYTDTEKKQNSLLFYDLWGVPANTRSRNNSSQYSVESDDNMTHQTSTSLSGLTSGPSAFSREQSTMLSQAIQEEDEWSDFNIQDNNDNDSDSDSDDNVNIPQTKLKTTIKKNSGGIHKYRKRKSSITDKFIFGRISNVKQ